MTKFQLLVSRTISCFIRLNPRFWIQFGKTSNTETLKIRNIITNDLVISVNECTCTLKDGSEIWIVNYPYSFAYRYDRKTSAGSLPDAYTRILFKKYLMKKFNLPNSYFD